MLGAPLGLIASEEEVVRRKLEIQGSLSLDTVIRSVEITVDWDIFYRDAIRRGRQNKAFG